MPTLPRTPCPDDAPLIIETPRLINEVGDDRDNIQPGDPLLLIVENDLVVRPAPAGGGPREGLQGPGHLARRRGAWR